MSDYQAPRETVPALRKKYVKPVVDQLAKELPADQVVPVVVTDWYSVGWVWDGNGRLVRVETWGHGQ
jgi:hypothetical protein